MGYFKRRAKQPSTWMGLAAAAFALASSNGHVTPDVVASLLAALGLIQIDESKGQG